MTLDIEPSGRAIGAVVPGIDLMSPPDRARLEQLEEALEKHGVLIFPGQQAVTSAQQVAFSRAFGPLDVTDEASAQLPDHPEIFVVGNTGETPVTFSPKEESDDLEWHSDHMHLAVPARASLLLARAVPPVGGDTLFACMYAAYDSLSPDRRRLCDGLQVIHDLSGLRRYLGEEIGEGLEAPVIRPLVRRHPKSRRKALSFGNQVSVGIVGWADGEARAFIADLTEQACAPAFRYRHRWRAGDAVLWDNRRVLHAGTAYDLAGAAREMHRTSIRETEPIR